MTTAQPNPLIDFTPISSTTYLSPPVSKLATPAQENESPPDFILFFSWGSAPPKNIVKYTTYYRAAYPTSTLILLTTPFKDLRDPTSLQTPRLTPVINLIASFTKTEDRPPRILAQVCSNAGAFKFYQLCRLYQLQIGSRLPVSAIFFDSSPGFIRFGNGYRAYRLGLPKPWYLRLPASVVVRTCLVLYLLMHWTIWGTDITRVVSKALNERGEEGVVEPSATRMYVFSEEDEMVDYPDVVAHAEHAKEIGWKVSVEKFVGSKHCAHVVVDQERYWRLVGELWSDSL